MLRKLIFDSLNIDKDNISLYIKNLENGEIVTNLGDKRVSSASLIKVPIMCEVLRQVMNGTLRLDQRLVVRSEDKVPFSILNELDAGNSYSLKDIITLMIIQSDNTATNILIDLVGMDNINSFAKRLGLKNTILQRKMLDFKAREAGLDNFTSAEDMASIYENIYRGYMLNNYLCDLMMDILKKQLDNSMIPLFLPDSAFVAHKTGELSGITHDAGIVVDNNINYIVCALTWDSDNLYESREAIGRISKIAYDYFNK